MIDIIVIFLNKLTQAHYSLYLSSPLTQNQFFSTIAFSRYGAFQTVGQSRQEQLTATKRLSPYRHLQIL